MYLLLKYILVSIFPDLGSISLSCLEFWEVFFGLWEMGNISVHSDHSAFF